MQFGDFSRLCSTIEPVSGRLETIRLVSDVLRTVPREELPVLIRFLMGRVFPDWSPEKLGIGPNLLYDAVAYVAGKSRDDLLHAIGRTGDVGLAVEQLLVAKEQTSFFTEDPSLMDVYQDLTRIAGTSGKRSQREKLLVLRRLFANTNPEEGKYLSRLILGDMRIGVGEGNLREAIALAFSVTSGTVEHAHQALNDLGEVAVLALQGEEALQSVTIRPFHPVRTMLAQAGTITGALAENGALAAEKKYDGSRFQFHRVGTAVRIYSRKLEDVSDALPDVTRQLVAATTRDVILDGEVIAVKNGRPMPFQTVLRRFRRKHDVEEKIREISLVPVVFDILFLDGKSLIDLPLDERRRCLEEAVSGVLAPRLVSDREEEIQAFYQAALDEGHEGIMLKTLPSRYTPGIRGKNWIKIKPEVDTLDLAVVGAEWGEGKRAHLFGSFLLACQAGEGELVPLTRVATGFSDEQLAEIFELLRDSVISQTGKEVSLEPGLVVEIGYAEIQVSPNYEGGFALRFPRFVRIRDDKGLADIETLNGIRRRYSIQQAQKVGGPATT